MHAPVALLAFYPALKEDFFPPHLEEELSNLFPNLVTCSLGEIGGFWESFLREIDPEVLITGWGAPRLPDQNLPSLRYLCHTAGGVRDLLSRGWIEEGLLVTNWGTTHANSVAECALMLTLAALRNVTAYALELHVDRGWSIAEPPLSLWGRRVGIHGLGAVARSLIRMLRIYQMPILCYSDGVPESVFREAGVERADSLEELFQRSNVIIEVEALTAKSRCQVQEHHLRMLNFGDALINVGRAGVIDQPALERVAREGWLRIGLDVFTEEPIPKESPFRGLRNVTLLPHIAGPTPDRRRDCGEFAVKNLKRYRAGLPLEAVVTLDIYDRST